MDAHKKMGYLKSFGPRYAKTSAVSAWPMALDSHQLARWMAFARAPYDTSRKPSSKLLERGMEANGFDGSWRARSSIMSGTSLRPYSMVCGVSIRAGIVSEWNFLVRRAQAKVQLGRLDNERREQSSA